MLLDRTFHPDEANQAETTGRLLETGRYDYRPDDHHGPTLYYAAAAIQKASGHNTFATMDGSLLRCTPLLFAVLSLVFGFLAIRKLLKPVSGFFAWLVPGLFVILLGSAPIFAFFATDFIQEMLLACFTLMMFWAGIGYLHARDTKLKPGTWAIFFGAATALAFATKETCVLAFAAAILAFIPFLVKRLKADALRTRMRDVVLGGFGFIIIACILYSDFGRDFHGVYNAFIAAPRSYLGRAAGSASSAGAADHVHPWWQYFQWLFADEYGVLAFFILCGICFGLFARFVWMTRHPEVRTRVNGSLPRTFLFTLCYSLLLLAFYSLIPYKTPWCALQMHVGLLLSALLGFTAASHVFSLCLQGHPRLLEALGALPVAIASFMLILSNGSQLLRMNRDPDSKEIPYNYASASPEVKQLAAAVADAMESGTNGEQMSSNNDSRFAAVVLPASDTWPFPWYNRPYTRQTGYWTSFDDFKRDRRYLSDNGYRPTALIVSKAEIERLQEKEGLPRPVESLFPYLECRGVFHMRSGVPVVLYAADMQESPEVQQLCATVSAAIDAASKHEPRTVMPFIASDVWIPSMQNGPYARRICWTSIEGLRLLAADGVNPAVVIVPMEQGHLVQPLFPHLKHTKRFYIRPGTPGREGKMRGGVRVRVFW